MFLLFSPIGFLAALFTVVVVGIIILPLQTLCQIVGVLAVVGGALFLAGGNWVGIAFVVPGAALVVAGGVWRARLDAREADEVAEAAQKARRGNDPYLPGM